MDNQKIIAGYRLLKWILIPLIAATMLICGMWGSSPGDKSAPASGTMLVQAAVTKPSSVKIMVSKKKSNKVTVKASWSGSAVAYYYNIYYENEFGWGHMEGQTNKKSATATFSHPEGQIRTYGVQVWAYDSSGNYSDESKKTTTFMRKGSYTNKIQKIINKNIDSSASTFEKIKFAHDWLIKNIDYDTNLKTVSTTLKGTMKNKEAVCEGYTIAFGVFMKLMKIPVKYVSNSQHSWNMVKLGGKWYNIDVTWDDPVGLESVTKKFPIYNYFLQSTKCMWGKDGSGYHNFATDYYPKATSTVYDNPGGESGYYENLPSGEDDYLQYADTFYPWKNGSPIG